MNGEKEQTSTREVILVNYKLIREHVERISRAWNVNQVLSQSANVTRIRRSPGPLLRLELHVNPCTAIPS